MPGDREPFQVLVICEGNLCRSASAQFVLGRMLPEARVQSAGMRAARGSRLCPVAAAAIVERYRDDGGHAERFAESFRSRPVSDIALDDFDLVLAATRMQRGELARMEPGSHDRMFTLREAAALLAGRPAATADGYAGVVSMLNRRRDATPVPTAGRARPWQPPQHPFDIPDAHGAPARRHPSIVGSAISTAVAVGNGLAPLARAH